MVQAIVLGTVGTAGATFMGLTAWGVRRMIGKQDKLDLLVRGDGNGNPGLGERIRDVHQEVTGVKETLEKHEAKSQGWQERIVRLEVNCENSHAEDAEDL
jgi:hypothetical protein